MYAILPLARVVPVSILVIITLAGVFPFEAATAVNGVIVPTKTVRVDTTDADVSAVYQLVTNYLNSRPDSLYDNPYWSESEKKLYAEPYSARGIIFQGNWVPRSFPPKILSIEREGEYYSTSILYYAENLDTMYAESNPWALQRLYARLENSSWKLFDPLRITTEKWEKTRIGSVKFIYPPWHSFDRELAAQTAHLADSLADAFKRPIDYTIEFYVTGSIDEMSSILGLDFTLNVSGGRAIAPNRVVLTSFGREAYAHEIVHVVLHSDQIHRLLSEGIATLIGGTGLKDFGTLVKELQEVWTANNTLSVDDFLHQQYQAGSFTHFYALGALLCRVALDEKGASALNQMLFSGSSDEAFYQAMEDTFGIDRENITAFVREKTTVYANME